MKKILLITVALALISGCFKKIGVNKNNTETDSSFYSLKAKSIDGKTVSMNDYKDKYIMIVNTASKCGYTYQYEGLEKLYQKHKNKLIVLGFPSNDFLWQEPGSNEKIKTFCKINYGVTFPLFAKIAVKGKKKHPIFAWLTNPELNGWNKKSPGWNFNKYLIDTSGKLVAHFGAKAEPLSKEIETLLK